MNIYRVLGTSIAGSLQAIGVAVRGLGESIPSTAPAGGWADQFSATSLHDRRGRRTVDALYRAATVRL